MPKYLVTVDSLQIELVADTEGEASHIVLGWTDFMRAGLAVADVKVQEHDPDLFFENLDED